MANLSFTPSTQIIRDLYSTAAEAIQAAKALGCDGYRAYLINGVTQYVPCSSYLQYENALRYKTVQGQIGAFGNDSFGNKLVGLQFANSKDEIQGDPFFTLGNFTINTPAVTPSTSLVTQPIVNDAVKSYTIQDIANRNLSYFYGKSYVDTVKQLVTNNLQVKVLFDPRKLDNYVLFSSLQERVRNVLMEIYNNFPAAIKVRPVSIANPSVSNYHTYANAARAEFTVSLYSISNPFNVTYISTGTTKQPDGIITPYRNFAINYMNYVVVYNGVEYPIISVTLPSNKNDTATGIQLTVNGDPFGSVVNIQNEINASFYIKPNQQVTNELMNGLSELASFLLNKDPNTGVYVSDFLFPKLSDNGMIVNVKETVFFPMYDDYNIDMFSNPFDTYTTKLNDLALTYDSVKTNLIARFLTTDSLKEFDTSDRKVNLLFQLYGKQFDEVKQYIDGIAYMTNVSYNKIENVPDLLIKNFAHMLGFETYEIEDENTLIDSLFGKDVATGSTMTPAEIDIELWRRILINAAYLFKSKGTRKSVEFILKLVGFPDEIFDLNEYVYVAQRPVNVVDTLNKLYVNSNDDPSVLLALQPFDSDGYPTVPLNVKFQENGNSIMEDKNNIGVFDFGKKYIDQYKKSGSVHLFELERTIDNKKSWVVNTTEVVRFHDDINGYTDYVSDDTRLTINSKEFEIYMASNKVLDASIFRQYMRNIGLVNSDLNFTNPIAFDSTNLSFNQFLRTAVNNFINPANRKVIQTYPTLTKVYYDYLKSTGTPMDSMRTLEFLGNFDTQWVKLIQQFIPATTITNAGKKVENSYFNDNKFKYGHGQNNDVSWLGTVGSEFQQKALKPVYVGVNNAVENQGDVTETILGLSPSFVITGKEGTKIVGKDVGNNQYFGVYYSMNDFCDENAGRFYQWESGVDYGNDTLFGGNINAATYAGTSRNGVFVVYNGSLYRLNTRLLFTSLTSLHTTGITTSLPPNTATLTVLGVTKNIWEQIYFNNDSRSITFQDSYFGAITSDERSFYMNSIGIALAFIQTDIAFDCPSPKPHVCYFNFSGNTVNMYTYSGSTYRTYIDSTGVSLKVKQPKFYGHSKDQSLIRPSEGALGYTGNWTTPYKRIFNWEAGKVYYAGEVVGRVQGGNKTKFIPPGGLGSAIYMVTGTTVTGTTNMGPAGDWAAAGFPTGLKLISGVGGDGYPTVTTGITGGMYQVYEKRTQTDPFMHVENAYIQTVNITDPNSSTLTVNLTKALNLEHVFSGTTPALSYRVTDNILNNQLYLSDGIGISMEGLYPVDPTKIGPFYTPLTDNVFAHTLGESLPLSANTDNFVSIQSLNDNFVSVADEISLIKSNPGYYLITKSCFLNFNFTLFFESLANILQTVRIRLVNSKNYLYDEQTFTFNGNDLADNRQYLFHYQGFFIAGDKVYLNIIPIDTPCTLSRYETIDYTHTEPDESGFSQLMDPRFRVLFNSGFAANKFGYQSEGLSIKPIYNVNDLRTLELKLNTGTNAYSTTRLIDTIYSVDPSYLYNNIFQTYYAKYATGDIQYNATPFDKLMGQDKLDFTFTVRSKDSNIDTSTPVTVGGYTYVPGIKANTVEFDVTYTGYYLGNTPGVTEFSTPSNAISIGKDVRRRANNFKKTLNYYPNKSFYSGTALDTVTTLTTNYFQSYDGGLNDFVSLNYSGALLADLKLKRRYYYGILNTTGGSAFHYYKKENDVYNNEIYQGLLAKVPEFNMQISNYELNDIVKVLNTNVPYVSGGTVVTKDVYKLYVCINDIHINHCYKDATGLIGGQIHEIYRPNGSRSCFIELEKYNPANFTPWGYEENMVNGLPTPNVIDYVYKSALQYDTSLPFPYTFGDLILTNYGGNNEFFRYIYQKPTLYNPTVSYYAGDFITSGVTEGGSLVYRYFFAKQYLAAGLGFPTANWTKLTTELFDHRSISSFSLGSASGVTTFSFTASWFFGIGITTDTDSGTNYSSTVARMPKTLPVTTGGTPFITTGTSPTYTTGGIVYGNRWNSVLLPKHIFIENGYGYPDNYEVTNTNKIVKNNGYAIVSGGTSPYVYTGPGGTFFADDNYLDNFNISRTGVTNIFLKPGVPTNATKVGTTYNNHSSIFLRPYQGEAIGLMPLFERLGREDEKNNPQLWIPSTTNLIAYDKSSQFLGFKYAVNRGGLYQYINDTPVTVPSGMTEQPYLDTTNWAEKDFCLVNNFTFYKDRTRVQVYEAKIESLTTGVTHNMYFYTSNLALKSGFTTTSFSGGTINNSLMTGINKFYDVTDTNRLSPSKHGGFKFRVSGTDILMDYTYEKDPVGYPLTGEFMGKLNIVNPCGHSATTFFGLLFNTNVNKLNRQRSLGLTSILPSQALATLPYVVRVIVNQSSNANVNLSVTTADVNSLPVVDRRVLTKYNKFDTKYSVIPQTDLVLTLSYSTNRRQTTFSSGRIDNLPIFVNNTLLDTNFIKTSISTDGFLETRTITLLNITNNSVINVNLAGVETVTTDVLQAEARFNVKNINISTSQL